MVHNFRARRPALQVQPRPLALIAHTSIMYAMTHLWFESALLPQGWASQVRLSAAEGHIERVAVGVPADAGDECHAVGVPGLPNVHSHAFQRGIAGLTERRGSGADSFWSWRELMYQFVARMDPDEFEALSALAYAQMLEGGFTHVGEFHYLHHDHDGVPFADPGELAGRVVAAAAQTGPASAKLHRIDVHHHLIPPGYLGAVASIATRA